MNTTLIYDFLKAIAVNNNRQWFQEHKNEYQTARQKFETEATQLIRQIASFDPYRSTPLCERLRLSFQSRYALLT